MLATVAYGLCVKRLLAGAGRYQWTRDDEVEAMGLPVAGGVAAGASLASASDAGAIRRRAQEKAAWRHALRAMAMLGQQA
jgi:hypothetical protein